MEYTVSKQDYLKWCTVPMEELENHPDRRCNIMIRENKQDLYNAIGNMMADELIAHNEREELTKWILPSGHLDQYKVFADRVNSEKIDCSHLHIFHMDDWLDWQFRPMPADSYVSAKAVMKKGFYSLFNGENTIPRQNIHWPDVRDPDAIDMLIEDMGGIDTVQGGVGARGMIAFDEQPRSAYFHVGLEEYANSKTRMTMINEDTIVAYAQRNFGGCYEAVPPCGITIGMKSILTAKRGIFLVTTGAWKQTVIRVAMFSEETTQFPITILANRLPELLLCTDTVSADHSLCHRSDAAYLEW